MNDQHYTQVYVVLWMHNYQMQSSNHFVDSDRAELWGHYKGKEFVTVVPIQIEPSRVVYQDEQEAERYGNNKG